MSRVIVVFVSIVVLCFPIVGCSNDGVTNAMFDEPQGQNPAILVGPYAVAKKKQLEEAEKKTVQVKIDDADLETAIKRYRINTSIDTGLTRFVGVDLNGDGVGEALVYFEGESWCISTGCRLVVFSVGENGFRKMSEIKRVKLPIFVGSSDTEGWRDLIVLSGNKGIGERLVALRFKENYPANATTVKEKLAAYPEGSERVLGGLPIPGL